jgi:hypothetical protein
MKEFFLLLLLSICGAVMLTQKKPQNWLTTWYVHDKIKSKNVVKNGKRTKGRNFQAFIVHHYQHLG